MKQTLFIQQLSTYFETFLPENQKRSKNTIAAYSDSFALLFLFLDEKKNIPHYLVDYKHFTPQLLDEFLLWLEKDRNYGAASKRQRMSAITSFLKYASRREMAALKACNTALAVELPRVSRKEFPYFTVEEIRILLNLPNDRTRLGGRDLVLLSLLYDSAARSQELCDLYVNDIKFAKPTKVKLNGKGNKVREIPISNEVSKLLKYHIEKNSLERENPLFFSQTKEKMTPACLRNLTKKYVGLGRIQNPEMFNEPKYSPHSFRHSKAIHMLEAGTALVYIRNFLGHSSIQSTEIYARVSHQAVEKALANRKIPHLAPEKDFSETEISPLPAFLLKLNKKIM